MLRQQKEVDFNNSTSEVIEGFARETRLLTLAETGTSSTMFDTVFRKMSLIQRKTAYRILKRYLTKKTTSEAGIQADFDGDAIKLLQMEKAQLTFKNNEIKVTIENLKNRV